MDLQPTKTTYDFGELDWLASRDGTEFCETVTLDLSKFTKSTDYPDGFIPAGAALLKDSTSGLYGPASSPEDGATEPTDADGHLYKNVQVNSGATKASGPLLWRGVVRADLVPVGKGAEADGIRYV